MVNPAQAHCNSHLFGTSVLIQLLFLTPSKKFMWSCGLISIIWCWLFFSLQKIPAGSIVKIWKDKPIQRYAQRNSVHHRCAIVKSCYQCKKLLKVENTNISLKIPGLKQSICHLVQLHIKVIFLFLNESRRFLLHIKKYIYKRYNLG